jgi:type IV pilus assembly protein PilA
MAGESALRKHPSRGEAGFTLIELMVVLVVMGILTAIALPSFLGQSDKSKDASAITNVRNLVTQMEACGALTGGTFVPCDHPAMVAAQTGLPLGAGAGQVEVGTAPAPTLSEYTLVAHSRSGTDFTLVRSIAGFTHSCDAPGSGACSAAGDW